MIRKGRRGGSMSVGFAVEAPLGVEEEVGLGGRLSCVDRLVQRAKSKVEKAYRSPE